jgi:hypothetical protein
LAICGGGSCSSGSCCQSSDDECQDERRSFQRLARKLDDDVNCNGGDWKESDWINVTNNCLSIKLSPESLLHVVDEMMATDAVKINRCSN